MSNVVLLGDCLELMKSIPDKSIDMILCDLPYGTTACKWDTIIPFEPLWKQYKRIIKDNGAIALTASQPFTSLLIMSNLKMFKYELIWDKVCATGALLAYKRIMKVHENISIFYRRQCTYNPQYTKRKREDLRPNKVKTKLLKPCKSWEGTGQINKHSNKYDDTRVNPKSILTFNKRASHIIHPTQKPVALFEYLIKTYTNEGDLVLDNCAGSGTTAIACLNTKRKYILMEKEPKYYEIIMERIRTHVIQGKLE
jgi:site-specific DNA-methyltransferase (adenine-specific)